MSFKLRVNCLIVFACLAFSQEISAQFRIMPISQNVVGPFNQRLGAIHSDTIPISLPLWDDFASSSGLPDSAFWISSLDVIINGTLGISPPSINVASFDGFNASGGSHNAEAAQVGPTDSLTSRPIDLSVVSPIQRNSVFLSFYWQIEGHGELPDSKDVIRVQFKGESGKWNTKWEMNGGSMEDLGLFRQELILVDSAQYFHETFQFRFQAFGNQTGSFDTWQIDYVYLNKNRNSSDIYSFDRTITSLPTSIFGDYTGIPMDQYRANPNRYLDSSQVAIFNLDAPNERQPISFSALLFNGDDGGLIEATDVFNNLSFTEQGQPTNSSISGQETRHLRARRPDEANLMGVINSIIDAGPADSVVLNLEKKFILHSSDGKLIDSIFQNDEGNLDITFFQHIDLKVNDTVSSYFTLGDYFAYDDGTAEFAAGVNQPGGIVAYQFILDQPDAITDVDIHFPRNASAIGSIEIFVWMRLSLDPDDILYRDNVSRSIILTSQLNEFGNYPLVSSVSVRDTFYIGFQQLSENRLGIGFDKNTDTFDRVFFNVSGAWEQDSTLHGSLMIRPRFRNQVVTAVPENPFQHLELQIFPNPTKGIFRVQGEFKDIRMFDLWGRNVEIEELQRGQFRVVAANPGIYIIKALGTKGFKTSKLLLQP